MVLKAEKKEDAQIGSSSRIGLFYMGLYMGYKFSQDNALAGFDCLGNRRSPVSLALMRLEQNRTSSFSRER